MNILILPTLRKASLFLSLQKELKKYFSESNVYIVDANLKRLSVCQSNETNKPNIC